MNRFFYSETTNYPRTQPLHLKWPSVNPACNALRSATDAVRPLLRTWFAAITRALATDNKPLCARPAKLHMCRFLASDKKACIWLSLVIADVVTGRFSDDTISLIRLYTQPPAREKNRTPYEHRDNAGAASPTAAQHCPDVVKIEEQVVIASRGLVNRG